MKKILLLMAALMTLVMSSCQPKFKSQVYYLDYYTIGHNGKVLLTESNSYSGDYAALGSIIINQTGGKEIVNQVSTTKEVEIDDGIYGSHKESQTKTKYKTGKYKQATFTTALEKAVDVAQEMGGDAIINLHCTVLDPSSVSVSGMVIKRK